MSAHQPPAHGGALVDLILEPEHAAARRRDIAEIPSWDLTPDQLVNLELLLSGAYSPLRGFMGREEAQRVQSVMRLSDGTAWSHAVTLEVSAAAAARLAVGARLALRDPEGVPLAVLTVEGLVGANADSEQDNRLVSGDVEGLQPPTHHDFPALRRTPASVRDVLAARGWTRTLAVLVPGLLHPALVNRSLEAAAALDAGIVVLGLAPPNTAGDAGHFGRVRALQAGFAAYPADRALLCLLPWPALADQRRDRLRRSLVARNFGCTHVADMDSTPMQAVPDGAAIVALSVPTSVDTEVAARLRDGREIPASLAFPAVVRELQRWHRPPRRRGVTVFMTGLSGSGKSTIANLLRVLLLERDERPVSLLDGDLVRKHLSSELGFSREHRELNVRRIAYVASEITKNGGIAICAPIAPFDDVRREARRMVEATGDFVLVLVDTPIEVCEARDPKGLYVKARAGIIPTFTGVSDPYERPEDADLVIDTTTQSADASAERIVQLLVQRGYLGAIESATNDE